LPMVNRRRGNPVLFSKNAVEEILAIPDLACRPYMDAHPEKIRAIQTSNSAFVLDVDTPEDIQDHKLTLS
jgi:molybdenum cofactor cytidylyltransferase